MGVKVGQSLQSTMCDGSNLNLLQRFFVNCVREQWSVEQPASAEVTKQRSMSYSFLLAHLQEGQRRSQDNTPSPTKKNKRIIR